MPKTLASVRFFRHGLAASRHTNLERLCQLLIFVALLVAAPVSAEVMDKEMSVPQIWQALAWGLLVAFIAAAIWRWLLVISFFLGPLAALGFTWTEWFNPSVGPAMRAEAGDIYGLHLNAALSLLFLAHIVLWLASTRRSLVRFFRTAEIGPEKQTRHALAFAAAIWTLALLETFGGFGATAWIWLSPPFIVVFDYDRDFIFAYEV